MKKELKHGLSKAQYMKAKERADRFQRFLRQREALRLQEFMNVVQKYDDNAIKKAALA